MRQAAFFALPVALLTLQACGDGEPAPTVEKLNYPETRQDSTAGDTLHGTWVADPYRWLEIG